MSEFGQLLGRVFKREENKNNLSNIQPRLIEVFDPIAEPDLARLYAFRNIYGVVNGTLPYEVEGGVEVIDFDHRDKFGYPTRVFYPGASIDEFEVK